MKALSIFAAAFGVTFASLPAQAAVTAPLGVRTAEALFEVKDFEVIRVQEGRTGLDAPLSRSERRRIARERLNDRRFRTHRGVRSHDLRSRQGFSRPARINRFKKAVILKKALNF